MPDAALLVGSDKLNVPFAGPVSFDMPEDAQNKLGLFTKNSPGMI